jgi:DNA-binding CsgD family transcriptional regulator/tetratricopeptide (TPR) repeat protein
VILERDAELERLHGLLAELDSSGGKAVLIRSEAGGGKTALVTQFLDDVRDTAHVLIGACDDLHTPQPLGPMWDLARDETAILESLEQGDRQALMEGLLETLSRKLRPTVLVIEDTQWADTATLDVIRFLGRRIERTNSLLIITYRDSEVDTHHPLREVIGVLPPGNLVRMQLSPLSLEAVTSLVDSTEVDPGEVMALTDGNPLFVAELAASDAGELPSNVTDAVLARAATLSPGARQIIDLLAVIPGGTNLGLIEVALDPSQDELTECAQRGFIQFEGPMMVFRHELTRRAIESALDAVERRALNRLALEHRPRSADASRIVHHAREAGDVDALIEFAPVAAQEAMAVPSYAEALEHFRALEPHLDHFDVADRAAILIDKARTERYTGAPEAPETAVRAIELYRSSGSDRDVARCLFHSVRVFRAYGLSEASAAGVHEAVEILEPYGPTVDLARALALAAGTELNLGDWDRVTELADRAIDVADQVGDDSAIIRSLQVMGSLLAYRGDPAGLDNFEKAAVLAEQGGDRYEESLALVNMAEVAVELLEFDRAIDLAQRARATAIRYEIPNLEAYAEALLAMALLHAGDWEAARDIAAGGLGFELHEQMRSWMLGVLQARLGLPAAGDAIERSWELAEASGEFYQLVWAANAYAEYLWLTGNDDPDLVDSLRGLIAEATRSPREWWRTSRLAFWLWRLGYLPDPPDWVFEPYRQMMAGQAAEAAAFWEKRRFPYEQALALAQGDTDDQIAAVKLLENLGASVPAGHIRRQLADQGVKVPRGRSRSTKEHAAGLTARQAEVLGLIAEDLTNPEIADRLFVSPRTVEHHVSAILTKLGVTSRRDAVEAARQQGGFTTP